MPTGIQVSGSILVGTQKPTDARYGPYASTSAALSDLTPVYRYKGLTVGIETGGVIKEYWFNNGIQDTDFVVKSLDPNSDIATTGIDTTTGNPVLTTADRVLYNANGGTVATFATNFDLRKPLEFGGTSGATNAATSRTNLGAAPNDIVSATAPVSGVEGQRWVNTALGRSFDWIDGVWVETGGGGGIPPNEKGAANGVATLDANQKLTSSQIPDIAITDFLGACANQTEMLAKTGQKGDWVTRSDDGKVYVITGDTPSQASSWTALSYPVAAAQQNADWDATSGVTQIFNKPSTFAPSAHSHTASEITDFSSAVTAAANGISAATPPIAYNAATKTVALNYGAGLTVTVAQAGASLLLNFNGSNGSTTFTDSSGNNVAVTANGGASISTAQSKFGGASLSSAAGYLTAPLSVVQFGQNDFTLEAWVWPEAGGNTNFPCVISNYSTFGSGNFGLFAGNAGSGNKWTFINNGVYPPDLFGTSDIQNEQWSHVAVVRSGNTLTLYVNGVAEAVKNVTGVTFDGNGNSLFIKTAGDNPSATQLSGYIDELRVVQGAAIYTGNFTPPTAPLTASGSSDALLVPEFGSTAGTVCQGDDARLSDSRTPTTHKSTHAIGGSDALTPADIGAAEQGLEGQGKVYQSSEAFSLFDATRELPSAIIDDGVFQILSKFGKTVSINPNGLSVDRTYDLPDAQGSFVVSSQLSNYIGKNSSDVSPVSTIRCLTQGEYDGLANTPEGYDPQTLYFIK